ncbi:phospholipase A2 [Xylaria palmicola]|nr:phospholipase A2 [Xylaria palmicola]
MAQVAEGESSDRWGSLLSKLNPIPRFPEFTGPYKVGTIDVEIPVSDLESPAPVPDNAADIQTVQFRIFYPCDPDATGKRIPWLPAPQRDYLSAYIKFLGVGAFLAEAASFLPRHLHYTAIPVVENAPILEPQTPNGRWPTMIFSHGLGGSRNAYSQFCGSLASHGVVVVCPEHRDGSAIASVVRAPSPQGRFFGRGGAKRTVPYVQIAHDATDEVHELRNDQLRIRLWELGLVHEAILAIDEGEGEDEDEDEGKGGGGGRPRNLNKHAAPLGGLAGRLHVREPGSIVFAGHSFGAASVVQFLKSVFYAGRPELETMGAPLYTPNWESAICRQVTPRNVTVLLDTWCLPLLAPSARPLLHLPLPAYAPPATAAARASPGGEAVLAVASEDFFRWREHLRATARVLSPDPSARVVAPLAAGVAPPHFFYVARSAHLNHSDFGLLFPWLARKVFGSEAPARVLRLNLRALLQVLRANGVPVAATRAADLVDGGTAPLGDLCADDAAILEREANAEGTGKAELVQAWRWIDIVGMGEDVDSEGAARQKRKKGGKGERGEKGAEEAVEETEPQMAGVIEPRVSASLERQVDADTAGIFAAAEVGTRT